jgi:hypothetical protein
MKETITRLSRELNLSPSVIEKAYRAYWMFVKQKIEKLPLKEDMDEQTFNRLRPNFNIPNLGKLTCTYERYLGVKKRIKTIKDRHAKHKED